LQRQTLLPANGPKPFPDTAAIRRIVAMRFVHHIHLIPFPRLDGPTAEPYRRRQIKTVQPQRVNNLPTGGLAQLTSIKEKPVPLTLRLTWLIRVMPRQQLLPSPPSGCGQVKPLSVLIGFLGR